MWSCGGGQLVVTIRASKTDQVGKGRCVILEACCNGAVPSSSFNMILGPFFLGGGNEAPC